MPLCRIRRGCRASGLARLRDSAVGRDAGSTGWPGSPRRGWPSRVFALVVAVFTALLSLPAATADGQRAPFVDALFTATSAVCVTGLVTVDTGTYWSTLGQVVILVGIQVGGLGIMTLASLLGLAVSRRLGLTQRLLASAETKTGRLGEVGVAAAGRRGHVRRRRGGDRRRADPALPDARRGAVGEAAVARGLLRDLGVQQRRASSPPLTGWPRTSDWWVLLPIIVGVFVGALGFPVLLNARRSWAAARVAGACTPSSR